MPLTALWAMMLCLAAPFQVSGGTISPSDMKHILKGYWHTPPTAIKAPHGPTADMPQKICDTAVQYQGRVPYRFGGVSVTRGMDCSAFSRMVFEKIGIRLPRTAREQANVGRLVPLHDLRAGDLVFFDASRKRKGIDHVGIMISARQLIHCAAHQGVVITRLDRYPHVPVFGRRIGNEAPMTMTQPR